MDIKANPFRIFISSTFSDMRAERDALQRAAFPQLEELCRVRGYRFQAVDLRWGVRDEAAKTHDTMRICLNEIRRCQHVSPRPNFIILVGQRYGWRPLPTEIPDDEFQEILLRLDSSERELLRFDENSQRGWFRLDRNSLPQGIWRLEPLSSRLSNWDEWQLIEATLRGILFRVSHQLSWPESRLLKYRASATEQEFEAATLDPMASRNHVVALIRTLTSIPDGLDAANFLDMRSEGQVGKRDETAAALMAAFRARIESAEGRSVKRVCRYDVGWDDRYSAAYLDQLCQDVTTELRSTILSQIDELERHRSSRLSGVSPGFPSEESPDTFIGRAEELRMIGEYVSGDRNRPLLVMGKSGEGKSSLLARALLDLGERHPDIVLINARVSETPELNETAFVVELVRRIVTAYEKPTPAGRSGPESFQAFQESLNLATPERRLIVVADGINELGDGADLSWIPRRLPPDCRLIVSSTPALEATLRDIVPPEEWLVLNPMREAEASELLENLLRQRGRTLQPRQQAIASLRIASCSTAIYVVLLARELSRWTSYQRIQPLADSLPTLVAQFLSRLSDDANHGAPIVAAAIGLLAAARMGLTEDELIELLSSDAIVFNDFVSRAKHHPPEKRLPSAIWIRLQNDLADITAFRHRDGALLLTFYHGAIREAILDLLSLEELPQLHDQLASFYSEQPDYFSSANDGRSSNLRRVSELPYQLLKANRLSELTTLLCTLTFVGAKCAAGRIHELLDDYNLALATLQRSEAGRQDAQGGDAVTHALSIVDADCKVTDSLLKVASVQPWTPEQIKRETESILAKLTPRDRLRAFAEFVDTEALVLDEHAWRPWFCAQHAFNVRADGPVGLAARDSLKGAPPDIPMLLLLEPFRPKWNPFPLVVRQLPSTAKDVAISADGSLAVSGSSGGLVEMWEVKTGRRLRQIDAHRGPVSAVALSADGTIALTGSFDSSLRVWNTRSGRCTHVLQEMQDESPTNMTIIPAFRRDPDGGQSAPETCIIAVALSPDGRQAASASFEKIIRVWDVVTGQRIATLEGHTSHVESLAISATGRLASGDWEGNVRIWSLETAECLRTWKASDAEVSTLAMSADGRILLTGSRWLNTGAVSVTGELSLKSRAVTGTASRDSDYTVWNADDGTQLQSLPDANGVGAALSADGHIVYCGRGVWDTESGARIRECDLYASRVAMAADGHLAIDSKLRVINVMTGYNVSQQTSDTDVQAVQLISEKGQVSSIQRGAYSARESWYPVRHDLAAGEWIYAPFDLRSRFDFGDNEWITLTADGSLALFLGHNIFDERELSGKDTLELQPLMAREPWVRAPLDRNPFNEVTTIGLAESAHVGVIGRAGDVFRPREVSLELWDFESCTQRWIKQRQGWPIRKLALSPDGKWAVTSCQVFDRSAWHSDGMPEAGSSTELHNPQTGETIATVRRTELFEVVTATGEVFKALGEELGKLWWETSNSLNLWNLETGEIARVMEFRWGDVSSLAVSPDAKFIVSAYYPTQVSVPQGRWFRLGRIALELWDAATGKCLRSFHGHKDRIQNVAISADGRFVISSAESVRVWDAHTGECVAIASLPFSHLSASGNLIAGVGPKGIAALRLSGMDLAHRPIVANQAVNGKEALPQERAAYRCVACGDEHDIDSGLLNSIRQAWLELRAEPDLQRAAKIWNRPELAGACPTCGVALSFAPILTSKPPLCVVETYPETLMKEALQARQQGRLSRWARRWAFRTRHGGSHLKTLTGRKSEATALEQAQAWGFFGMNRIARRALMRAIGVAATDSERLLALRERIRLERNTGRCDSVVRALREAIDICSREPILSRDEAELRLELASLLLRQCALPQAALEEFKRLETSPFGRGPQGAFILFGLCLCYSAQGEKDAAVRYYQRLLRLTGRELVQRLWQDETLRDAADIRAAIEGRLKVW